MKTSRIILISVLGLIIIIQGLYIWKHYNHNGPLDPNLFPNYTDTIYVQEPYVPKPPLPIPVKPLVLTIYETIPIKVDSVIIKPEYIYVHTPEDIIKYHKNFLTNFPKAPKLLDLHLNKTHIRLNTLTVDGRSQQQDFNIDLDHYNYQYQENGLSAKRVKSDINFSFQAGYTIRPLRNLHDLNFIMSLKTSKINYIGGINLYYYPQFEQPVGITPILGITYNF